MTTGLAILLPIADRQGIPVACRSDGQHLDPAVIAGFKLIGDCFTFRKSVFYSRSGVARARPYD